jgi:hypothetical protein
MGLLPLLTRDQVTPELQSLWDELERVSPQFRHLWHHDFLELDVEPGVPVRGDHAAAGLAAAGPATRG